MNQPHNDDVLIEKLSNRIDQLERLLGSLLIQEVPVVSFLKLQDGIAAPSTVVGVGILYIDTADGDLKIKFGDGTVKTIVTDT